jgi:hypothetical protein
MSTMPPTLLLTPSLTPNAPRLSAPNQLVDKVKADQPDNLCAKYLEKV